MPFPKTAIEFFNKRERILRLITARKRLKNSLSALGLIIQKRPMTENSIPENWAILKVFNTVNEMCFHSPDSNPTTSTPSVSTTRKINGIENASFMEIVSSKRMIL
jgi:hypothetical protein